MTNVMVNTCLHQIIIKISNLIQAMKNNVCPKATVIRRPNFSENRICPKIHRMFRSVDWTHNMITVKWCEVTVIQFFRKPNLSEYLPNVPKLRSVDWTHDMIIVKWREVTLIQFVRTRWSVAMQFQLRNLYLVSCAPCLTLFLVNNITQPIFSLFL